LLNKLRLGIIKVAETILVKLCRGFQFATVLLDNRRAAVPPGHDAGPKAEGEDLPKRHLNISLRMGTPASRHAFDAALTLIADDVALGIWAGITRNRKSLFDP
jgi:hypothetical protein